MERHLDKMPIQSSDVTGHVEKPCVTLERGDDDAWNASSDVAWNASMICKLTGEIDNSFRSHIMDIKTVTAKAASSQLKLDNLKFEAPLCNGAPTTIPAKSPQTSQVFPFTALAGLTLSNKGYLGSGHLSFGNGIMGASGLFLKPFQAQSKNFDVQLSEVCQRRFVMFDHSGSKRRMIFHPAMMNEFSALLPSSLQTTAMDNLGPLTEECDIGEDTSFARPSLPACISALGVSYPCYDSLHSHLMRTYAAKDSMSSASDNCDTPLLADGEYAGAQIEMNHLDDKPELSCFSHENTEDLEALLSSDEDEVSSTGHSPSDLTRNNSPTSSPSNSEAYSMCISKKRKREFGANMDDTRSTATSGDKMCKEVNSRKMGIAESNSAHIQEGLTFHEAAFLRPMGYASRTLDMFFPDEVSSSSSANNQGGHDKLPTCLQQPQEQRPTEQSRKEKIKNILRLLRGVIPGGESMDTAFVLDEAIQYVRTLQSEVQKLQTRKLA